MIPWLKGLAAFVISGAASAITAAYVLPTSIHLDGPGLIALGKIASAGGLLATAAYLKQSPLPGKSGEPGGKS